MANLKNNYLINIIPKLIKNFNLTNIHQIPKLKKIIINAGIGISAENSNILKKIIYNFSLITGQYPKITKSKKSISNFKTKQGIPLGLVVTLRKEKMYSFLEKLIKLVLPRIRDFQGLKKTSFDKQGNYNLGIKSMLLFPEINYNDIEQDQGFDIVIISNTNIIIKNYYLLKEFGLIFKK